MKKLMAIVLCLVMMLSMAACGQTANSAEAPTEPKETGILQEAPKGEPTEEQAEVTKPAEVPTKAPVAETSKAPVAETTKAPVAETSKAPVAETTKAPVAETTKAPAAEPTKASVAETTKAPVAETTKEPTKAPEETQEESQECAHRWEAAGDNEEGMILYECMDCSAMKLEYKCTHEYCIPENLTNSDGTSYIRYTCYGCGYTYTSSNTAGQDDKVEDSDASVEEPVEVPTEAPEEPSECTSHRYDYSAEPETGFVFRTCLDCSAQQLVYKCPHDVLYKEHLTDADGATYTRSICYGCNEEFITYD